MAIDYHQLKQWEIPEQVTRYREDDCIRYALSLGIASDPMDAADLRYVHERDTLVVPTFLATLGAPGAWASDPGTGIDWMRILHGEHRMRFHAPLPASGSVRSRTRVSHVVDKGAGKGALVVTQRTVTDADSGVPLATVDHVSFCRADGGFANPGQPADAPLDALPAVPGGQPDMRLEMPTRADAALLYRLNGDRNPIHILPAAAREAGFERPILHGLCTYGMAARAVLRQACGGAPSRLASLAARFSSPVVPGETLRADLWRVADQVRFQLVAVERDAVVLSHGVADLRHE
ncbi:MaoC/PaaZ C-terminal domain-containing protein [Achromobacter sp. UMC46]|uniref:MaoC/PaaZ C-terminal domain-containing protein n=1 Tax=Achromobacter sp. UMC46 TaxID=1862319 RepID=UPI0016006A85|nr:MaoC/PaaZ C-terminal domain-containing protein [Achromobacter sp. UMC46]MBB1594608.1 3-alpha,7-alpha,12-alpha-trihydroxy-5-beta-cholest-24-enoyl-CoA hydratase [Achromobacter sp. UMC46]